MKSLKNYLIFVFLLTTIATGVLAWKQHQELLSLHTAAMTPDERAAMQKRIWDAEKRAQQAKENMAVTNVSAVDGSAANLASPDAAGSGNPQNQVFGDMVNTWIGMMNDPEAQRLMALQQKAGISSRYADLFKKLALPADKLAEFKAELLEKQTARNDVLLAAAQQGINPMQNPQEYKQLEANIDGEIDKKVKATLGDDAYAQYQSFQATQGQRAVVNQLQQSLSYTDSPLTSSQGDQVAQILANTGPQHSTSSANSDNTSTEPNKTNSRITNATIAQAQGVLQPSQVQALQEIQAQQQAVAQLKKIMRQNSNNNPSAAISGTATTIGGK